MPEIEKDSFPIPIESLPKPHQDLWKKFNDSVPDTGLSETTKVGYRLLKEIFCYAASTQEPNLNMDTIFDVINQGVSNHEEGRDLQFSNSQNFQDIENDFEFKQPEGKWALAQDILLAQLSQDNRSKLTTFLLNH